MSVITDKEIRDIATRVSLGMSKNQILDYVIKSHVTEDRQLKQVLLEIENIIENKYMTAKRYIKECNQYGWTYLDPEKNGQRSNLYKFILITLIFYICILNFF